MLVLAQERQGQLGERRGRRHGPSRPTKELTLSSFLRQPCPEDHIRRHTARRKRLGEERADVLRQWREAGKVVRFLCPDQLSQVIPVHQWRTEETLSLHGWACEPVKRWSPMSLHPLTHPQYNGHQRMLFLSQLPYEWFTLNYVNLLLILRPVRFIFRRGCIF